MAPWGKPGAEIGLDLEYGGMTSLTMTSYKPDNRSLGGRINITVQPSNRVGNGEIGIYVEVNDHFAIDTSPPGSCEFSMRILAENFDKSLSRSFELINHIMSLTYKQET